MNQERKVIQLYEAEFLELHQIFQKVLAITVFQFGSSDVSMSAAQWKDLRLTAEVLNARVLGLPEPPIEIKVNSLMSLSTSQLINLSTS